MRGEESSLVVTCADNGDLGGDLDRNAQNCTGTGDCDEGVDDADNDDDGDDDDDGVQHGGHWKRRPGDGAAQTH